jgi:hypothetical protein
MIEHHDPHSPGAKVISRDDRGGKPHRLVVCATSTDTAAARVFGAYAGHAMANETVTRCGEAPKTHRHYTFKAAKR